MINHATRRRRLGAAALLGTSAASAAESAASAASAAESAASSSCSSSSVAGPAAVLVCGDVVVLPERVMQGGFVMIGPDGVIESITSVAPPARPGGVVRRYHAECVLPGMVDIHTHGLGGAEDVVDYWGNAEYSLRRLVLMQARRRSV